MNSVMQLVVCKAPLLLEIVWLQVKDKTIIIGNASG